MRSGKGQGAGAGAGVAMVMWGCSLSQGPLGQAGFADVPGAPGSVSEGVAGAVVLDLLPCEGVAGLLVWAGHAAGASAKKSSAVAVTRRFEGMATM